MDGYSVMFIREGGGGSGGGVREPRDGMNGEYEGS